MLSRQPTYHQAHMWGLYIVLQILSSSFRVIVFQCGVSSVKKTKKEMLIDIAHYCCKYCKNNTCKCDLDSNLKMTWCERLYAKVIPEVSMHKGHSNNRHSFSSPTSDLVNCTDRVKDRTAFPKITVINCFPNNTIKIARLSSLFNLRVPIRDISVGGLIFDLQLVALSRLPPRCQMTFMEISLISDPFDGPLMWNAYAELRQFRTVGVKRSTQKNTSWHALSNEGRAEDKTSCCCCRKQSGRDWIKVSGKGPLDGLLFSPIQLDVSLSCQGGNRGRVIYQYSEWPCGSTGAVLARRAPRLKLSTKRPEKLCPGDEEPFFFFRKARGVRCF